MSIQQPTSSNTLNSPDHSLSHRVVANDDSAPVKKIVVEADGTAKIGDSVGGNSTIIKPDGEINLEGTARVTKQLYLDNANFGKGGTAPSQEIDSGFTAWDFDIGDDSVLVTELPADWASGTDVILKVCWYVNDTYSSDKEVQWRIDWKAVPHDASETIISPTHSGQEDSGDINIPAVAYTMILSTVGTIVGADLSAGDMFGLTLSRIGVTNDDPANNPRVHHLAIVYTVNKLGKATE